MVITGVMGCDTGTSASGWWDKKGRGSRRQTDGHCDRKSLELVN